MRRLLRIVIVGTDTQLAGFCHPARVSAPVGTLKINSSWVLEPAPGPIFSKFM